MLVPAWVRGARRALGTGAKGLSVPGRIPVGAWEISMCPAFPDSRKRTFPAVSAVTGRCCHRGIAMGKV